MRIIISFLAALSIILPPVSARAQETAYRTTDLQDGVSVSSDFLTVALPATAAVISLATEDWQGFKQLAFTGLTAVGATLILKYSIDKERPNHADNHSMCSGHAAVSFASATFLQRRYGWKIGVPAYIAATYVGWARIYSKNHDIWDVLAGAAIGAGSALIYTTPFARKHQLSIAPATDGRNFIVSASFTF